MDNVVNFWSILNSFKMTFIELDNQPFHAPASFVVPSIVRRIDELFEHSQLKGKFKLNK